MDRNLAPWSCRAATRADPALVFDAREPGAIFVVRNVANLVPPFEGGGPARGGETLAALEYAVTRLRVPLVVVMGHTRCGGVAASLQNTMTARSEIPRVRGERGDGGGVHRDWVAPRGDDAKDEGRDGGVA